MSIVPEAALIAVNNEFRSRNFFTVPHDTLREMLALDEELVERLVEDFTDVDPTTMGPRHGLDTMERDWAARCLALYLGFECWPWNGSPADDHKAFSEALGAAAKDEIIVLEYEPDDAPRKAEEADSAKIIAFCNRLTDSEAMKIMDLLQDRMITGSPLNAPKKFVMLQSLPQEAYSAALGLIRSYDPRLGVKAAREALDAVLAGTPTCVLGTTLDWQVKDLKKALKKLGGDVKITK